MKPPLNEKLAECRARFLTLHIQYMFGHVATPTCVRRFGNRCVVRGFHGCDHDYWHTCAPRHIKPASNTHLRSSQWATELCYLRMCSQPLYLLGTGKALMWHIDGRIIFDLFTFSQLSNIFHLFP